MPKKPKLYLVVDTETATLPFVNEIAETAKERQKIAIAKPIIYDIGWTIVNRKGEIIKTCSYLIQETFFVPQVFNTAYYKNKRNLYIDKLQKGEIFTKNWNTVIDEFIADLNSVELVCAYNAPFDLKKAIPFTDKYIAALYGTQYQQWEDGQRFNCKKILNKEEPNSNSEFLEPIFKFYEIEKPICDLWSSACETLLNNRNYKNFCLNNGRLSNSKLYFSTNAESVFQFLEKDNDFTEEHTALADALIESTILTKIAKKQKIEPCINSFPFRSLGTTVDYLFAQKSKRAERQNLADLLEEYAKNLDPTTAFYTTIEKEIQRLLS